MIEGLRSKRRRMRSLFQFNRKALRLAFMLQEVMGGRFFEEGKEGEEFVEIEAGWISRVSMAGNLFEPLTLK